MAKTVKHGGKSYSLKDGKLFSKHNLEGPHGGGGSNVGRAQRTSVSHSDRGGFGHHGQHAATSRGTESGMVPGGHKSSAVPRGHGGGGTGADSRIRAHFHGAHHGGHEHLKGKHAAGKMSHNAGDHEAHSAHPHNLPSGFGKLEGTLHDL